MEVKNVSCCDTAALVALVNMLKVNLGSTPEVYNTLLAVLCDFDPYKHGNRERTVRYIRLLVTDKVLANCLLMSLPQGAEELQDLPFYTGSLPDMKRAIRHKFLGMKLSVQSPHARPEEKSTTPSSVTNQNITIIVTDQDEVKSTSVQDANYNHSMLQTEYQQGSDTTSNKTTSSQTKCIITFTNSSLSGLSKDTPALTKASLAVDSTVSKAVQPSREVGSMNESGNMTERSMSADSSIHESQSQPYHVLGTKVSGTDSQSKLENLITLVKSRTEGNSNLLQDKATSLQCPATNVIPSPVYQGAYYSSACVRSEQQFSHNQKQNIHPNPQARLPNPFVPLLYQQYAYPIPGNTSYQSCLTGYTGNPLLPWTPLTYIPGYSPSQTFPVGPALQYGRPLSTSSTDATLDLSVQRKSCSQAQSCLSEISRKGEKRCASASSVPNENENKEPKHKVRRLSTEVPVFPATRYVPPYKEDAMKSQSSSSVMSGAASYLCLAESKGNKDVNQPNSLQALQELTFRINANSGVGSTSGLNPSMPRKSLSTGSFSDSWQRKMLHQEQNNSATGKSNGTNLASNLEALKRFSVPSTQKLLLPGSTPVTSAKPLTEVQVSTSKQFHLSTPSVRKDIASTEPQKLIHSGQTLAQQEITHTSCSSSIVNLGSNEQKQGATGSSATLLPSDINKTSSICLRSFPYSQHIQLPDGNFSIVDFPALLSQNTKNSTKKPVSYGKVNASSQEPSSFNFQSGILTDTAKELSVDNSTKTLSNGAKSDRNLTVGTAKDCPSRYSLYLKRNDSSSKMAEKGDSKPTVPANDSLNNVAEIEQTKSNETCLIIETTTENGTEQVQFKLDKKSSANLLGELLKLKPESNSTACGQIGANCGDSQKSGTELFNDGQGNCGLGSHQNRFLLNNDIQSVDGDDVYTQVDGYKALSENVAKVQNDLTKAKNDLNSVSGSTFSSLNVSPYLLGMLPDTTTFTDDDAEEQEEFSDCDDDDDDDVFLHPIF
ncbi:uncharacterized protein LOC123547129 [Mercenaria mercenaria]|uniref:uncharacterized protein LOC123547129 n=1 Tax=Mercenaria mercenaria TaxID=6596 RepID=UPI00234EE2BF|nr:uncharacterized protein LOC123547129 [Mercenaria mercenaria]XP_045189907.2 uncharacterized protein LOC123547129 [Mercenaria mercenaria]